MKRGVVNILVLISFLLILSFVSAGVKTSFNTTVDVYVWENNTFDLAIKRPFNSGFWIVINWQEYLGKQLKNVRIFNQSGELKIKEVREDGDWAVYVYDTGVQSRTGFRPIYINSSGNGMIKINDYLYHLFIEMSSYKSEWATENTTLNLHLPETLTFLSIQQYDKLDTNPNNLTFFYDNRRGYFYILLAEKDYADNFIELEDDNKIYLVQNNEKLISAVKKLFKNKDLIINYPKNKKDLIIISISNTRKLDENNIDSWGLNYENNLILIDGDLIKKGSEEELLSVLLHEMTHYSEASYNGWWIYPDWLLEGIAVYTEIRYIEKEFPGFGGFIPTNWDFYQRKPTKEILESWYNLEKDFYAQNYTYNLSSYMLYSLYGFPVNYYSQVYGESILKSTLENIRDKKLKEELRVGFIKEEKFQELIIKSFKKKANTNITREELFFPKKNLYLTNKTDFYRVMKNFIVEPIPAEKLIEYKKLDKEERGKNPLVIWIILIIVLVSIGLTTFLIIKAKGKTKKK